MNKLMFIIIITITPMFSAEIFWDLGVGITKYVPHNSNQEILSNTYHRFEGMKKYYDMDYNAAIFHFESIDQHDRAAILYEYLDCLYLMEHNAKALSIINSYSIEILTDNLIYLKSKIYYKLGLYSESLKCLTYIQQNFTNSDYKDIIIFDIEKLHLLINE